MLIPLVLLAVLAAAAAAVFLLRRKPAPPVTPPASQWQIRYSNSLPATLLPEPAGFGVDIPPAPGSIHYVVAPAVAVGQTVTLQFSLSGGTLIPSPGSGNPPARLRLFLQRKNDNMTGVGEFEFYRWWSLANAIITDPGEYTLSAPVDPAQWTSVFGLPGSDPHAGNLFAAALANIDVAGFTFGADFAGHGCSAAGNPVHFTLKSYAVA